MKKRLLSILSLVLIIAMVGCSNKTAANKETTTKDESSSEIQSTPEETTPEETTTEPEPEPITVDIIMVGDMLMHTRVNESGLMADGTYNYDHIFAQVKEDIEAADIAIVNQETIIGGRDLGLSGYPSFNSAFELADSIVDAGFDVVLHATNHALDKRKNGLLKCLEYWDTTYPELGVLGIHDTAEDAEEIYVEEVDGIRIAILNYTYGTNGVPLPNDMPFAVDMWNEAAIKADVEAAKLVSDFIIVCPHWGTEYVFNETKDQTKKAQFLADLGVDLIIGTHPHVVEPVKWLEGKDGNDTLCYYSIGNFINATSGDHKGAAARMLGAMAKVTLTTDGEDVWIEKYGVEPLVTHLVAGSGLITTYRLSDYTAELEALNQMKNQDDSFSIEYCVNICKDVFGDLYYEDVIVEHEEDIDKGTTGDENVEQSAGE